MGQELFLKAMVVGGMLLGVFGGSLGAASPASALTPTLPVSTSLATVPSEVSWPGSRDFEYRVAMTAGPTGADFIFTVPQPRWGIKGAYGSPFSYLKAPTLDGPGTISPAMSIAADPAVFSCWRGGFSGSQNWYEITLDPGASTTVVVPARLEAAPLPGMTTLTDFRMENGDDPVLVDAPVSVTGKQGVLITTRMAGKDPKLPATIASGQRFVLRGATSPAKPNRKINIRAQNFTPTADGKVPAPFRIATVKTDAEGNFNSGPLRINYQSAKGTGPAAWLFTTRFSSKGNFARETNCGPALFLSRSH